MSVPFSRPPPRNPRGRVGGAPSPVRDRARPAGEPRAEDAGRAAGRRVAPGSSGRPLRGPRSGSAPRAPRVPSECSRRRGTGPRSLSEGRVVSAFLGRALLRSAPQTLSRILSATFIIPPRWSGWKRCYPRASEGPGAWAGSLLRAGFHQAGAGIARRAQGFETAGIPL